jgi:hypothetical protein
LVRHPARNRQAGTNPVPHRLPGLNSRCKGRSMSDPNRPRYTLEHGSYYLRNPRTGDILTMTDQVTIAFSCTSEPDDTEMWVIHKHGSLKSVQVWWKKNREVVTKLFGTITLVTFPPKFDPERINSFIELPATLVSLFDEVDVLPDLSV